MTLSENEDYKQPVDFLAFRKKQEVDIVAVHHDTYILTRQGYKLVEDLIHLPYVTVHTGKRWWNVKVRMVTKSVATDKVVLIPDAHEICVTKGVTFELSKGSFGRIGEVKRLNYSEFPNKSLLVCIGAREIMERNPCSHDTMYYFDGLESDNSTIVVEGLITKLWKENK